MQTPTSQQRLLLLIQPFPQESAALSRSVCACLLRSPPLGTIVPDSRGCDQLRAKVHRSGKASFTTSCSVFHPGGKRDSNVVTLDGRRSGRHVTPLRSGRSAAPGARAPLPAEPRLPVSPVFANSVARLSGTTANTAEMRPHGANTATACLRSSDTCAAATATPAEGGGPRRTARPRGQNSASCTERTYQSLGSGHYRSWRLRERRASNVTGLN